MNVKRIGDSKPISNEIRIIVYRFQNSTLFLDDNFSIGYYAPDKIKLFLGNIFPDRPTKISLFEMIIIKGLLNLEMYTKIKNILVKNHLIKNHK